MRPITAKKLITILLAHDFVLSRQKGSHQIYRHRASGIIVPIPLHGRNKKIPIGTLLAIIKQSKIPKDKFQ
ncbi:type II toxin-antitoxin system HicA family toxin [Candidatus Falkowbacteria bacterium]|nr:type II toxin-antitoxin system HicA family toxin [Candidatus Falkowbacteria bacterium]